MQMIDGIPVWGVPQDNAVEQMRTCKRTAARVALMADHHLGYAVPTDRRCSRSSASTTGSK